jgi:hypothetical protein
MQPRFVSLVCHLPVPIAGDGSGISGQQRKIASRPSPALFLSRVSVSDARKTMRGNHEETKNTKKDQKKNFAPFVSSWLIFRRM